MKITEKMLLDRYDGKTNGGDNISLVGGAPVYWCYRRGELGDGYNPCSGRHRAGEISLEYTRAGTIPLMADCADHPSVALIATDEAEMWGVEVGYALFGRRLMAGNGRPDPFLGSGRERGHNG